MASIYDYRLLWLFHHRWKQQKGLESATQQRDVSLSQNTVAPLAGVCDSLLKHAALWEKRKTNSMVKCQSPS